jgi:UDP-N-acetylglucosamine 2-epimerase
MKIISIVGARPEFIQAAAVSRALRFNNREILVHTGQHYDYLMSRTFFEELDLPSPDYDLGVGSGSHARQTGEILIRLEEVLIKEKPDLVIVRGDTNSTLAGALAASKLQIPTAHLEAGERSFDRTMPEEINRLATDCISDLWFCVSKTAIQHLYAEGIQASVYFVGDVMLDILMQTLPLAVARSNILNKLGVSPKEYALVTVHRAGNTDNPERLRQIVTALNSIPDTIILPAHPRTRKALMKNNIELKNHIHLIEPLGYLEMLTLEKNSRLIATDSGGVQREAYYLGIPCLTLRDETEWIETVSLGWNKLTGTKPEKILEAWYNFGFPSYHPPIYGDGNAGIKIAQIIDAHNFTFGGLHKSSFLKASRSERRASIS